MSDRKSWSGCGAVLCQLLEWEKSSDERTELFLAVEPEVPDNDDQLADQSYPERR